MDRDIKPSEEQLAYAYLLNLGMKIGLSLLILTFIIYLTGLLSPYIPIGELTKVWGLNVLQYLQFNRNKAWINYLSKGDFLNFLPLAFFGSFDHSLLSMNFTHLFQRKRFSLWDFKDF